MIALNELRQFTEELAGPAPEDATAQECLDKLRFRIGWLENVWQACHERHVDLERPTLVVVEPTRAETALAVSLGQSMGAATACVAVPDRKEQG